MNQRNIIKPFLVVGILSICTFFIWGCLGGSSSSGTTANPLGPATNQPTENPVTISGTIIPPVGMTAADFKIVNAFQTQDPASNGAFSTTVSEKTPIVTFAVATASNKVLSSITIGNSTPMTINSQTTAETLVQLSPFLIANSEADFNRISQAVKGSDAVKNLAKVIETLYASSTASMSDPALTAALSEAVKSVLEVLPVARVSTSIPSASDLKKNKSVVGSHASKAERLSLPNSQISVSPNLKIKNFDMAVLTLNESATRTIKLNPDTGTNGVSTNVNWKARIVELDPTKITWDKSNDFLFRPEYIDGWLKTGGFQRDVYVKGQLWWLAKTWKNITDALDPLKLISEIAGDLLFPDAGITVDHDGVFAVIAFSGTPSNDPNYPDERVSIFARDWQYSLWQDAMISNLVLATLDIVDTSLKIYTIYTGTELGEGLKLCYITIKGLIKSLATGDFQKWGFSECVKIVMEAYAKFIASLPSVSTKLSGKIWERVKEFINIPLKSAATLIETGIGIISAGTRIGDWLVNATPRETACVIVGEPWKKGTTTGIATGPDTTSQINYTLQKPTILDPTANKTNTSLNPTISASQFSASNSGITHLKTDWEVSNNASLAATNRVWTKLSETVNKTAIQVTAGNGVFENSLAGKSQLAMNTNYWVRLRFYDNNGKISEWSDPVSFFTLGEIAGVPGGLQANAGDGMVTLYWNPVSGAESYTIYWGESPGVNKSSPNKIISASTPFPKFDLTNGRTYYFVITATKNGIETGESLEVAATPVQGNLNSQVMKVAAGLQHSVALKNDGTLWVWGNNSQGQLGPFSKVDPCAAPRINSGILSVSAVTANFGNYTAVLMSDGTVRAWGSFNGVEKPATSIPGLNNVVALSGALALKSDGSVWKWVEAGNFSPIVLPSLSKIKAISATNHYLAVTQDGKVYAWGSNSWGQLGDGSRIDRLTPILIPGLENIKSVAAGDEFSLAVANDGSVFSWGINNSGQLGNESKTAQSTPGRVVGIANAIAVSAGNVHSLAIAADRTVYAWGYGQCLGNGGSSDQLRATQVSGLSNITNISAGHRHSLACSQDGKIYSWGENNYGQIGDGSLSSAPVLSPKEIPLVSTVPQGPATLNAQPGDAFVILNWTPVPDAYAYFIYFSTTPGLNRANATQINFFDTTTTKTIWGLTNGNTYYFFVTGRTNKGETLESPEIAAIPVSPIDNEPPEIIYVNPVENAAGVSVDDIQIGVNFNEAIDWNNLPTNPISVSSGTQNIAGALSMSGRLLYYRISGRLPYESVITVTVSSGFKDLYGNTTTIPKIWNFKTKKGPDLQPPYVVSVFPNAGDSNVDINSLIVATFSEQVQVPISPIQVTIDGNSIPGTTEVSANAHSASFKPDAPLPYSTVVNVKIPAGICDVFSNSQPDEKIWSFTTQPEADTTPPTVTSFKPADNAFGDIASNTNLVITFNENIVKGTSGNVVIKKISDNSIFETIPVTTAQVVVTASQATISPTGVFNEATGYYLTIDNTCFKDVANNSYAGIGSTTTWNFTTSGVRAFGTGVNGDVWALKFDSNNNPYVGGSFTTAGGVSTNYIAKWNGASWLALGTGFNNECYALAFDSNGNLYAGGNFTTAGGVSTNYIAKWDGVSWSALGTGFNSNCNALTFDSNGNLYAGGNFTTAGGVSTNYIAKWNGASWTALGTGFNGKCNALTFDSNGNLYAGGDFTTAGGLSTNYIAKWNGVSWSALGTGLGAAATALAFDSNGNLYAGGYFFPGVGGPGNFIAKWDGVSWSALGTGFNTECYALAFDSKDNLYAGGDFTTAGGVLSNYIAIWAGNSWSPLGTGMNNYVSTLAFDSNGMLCLAGNFTTAFGASHNRVVGYIP